MNCIGSRSAAIYVMTSVFKQTVLLPLLYMHTHNVLSDCMLTFTPAKTMFLAGEEREVELSTY